MGAAEIAALIAALSQSGVNIFLAIQQANALNAAPDPTPDQIAALDAALQQVLADSDTKRAAIQALRDAALAKAPSQ